MSSTCCVQIYSDDISTGGYKCVPCGRIDCDASRHCEEIMTPVEKDGFFLCGRTDPHAHCPKCMAVNCTDHGVS